MSSSSPGSRGQAFFSVDLAAASRRLLAFLRSAAAGGAVGPRSVRRYEDLWLPLAAEAAGGGGEEPAMLVPPPDVQLIWLCHCFHHVSLVTAMFSFTLRRVLENYSCFLYSRLFYY
jgi:hypothetical protein